MPKYSEASEAKLKTAHRDLQILFRCVIQDYDNTIVCGERNKADQDKAFMEGKSKLVYPSSMHNLHPSWAIDAAPYENGKIDWGEKQAFYFAGCVKGRADQLYAIGTMAHRIRCGIDFDKDNDIDDSKFMDAYHFELIPNERDKS